MSVGVSEGVELNKEVYGMCVMCICCYGQGGMCNESDWEEYVVVRMDGIGMGGIRMGTTV